MVSFHSGAFMGRDDFAELSLISLSWHNKQTWFTEAKSFKK